MFYEVSKNHVTVLVITTGSFTSRSIQLWMRSMVMQLDWNYNVLLIKAIDVLHRFAVDEEYLILRFQRHVRTGSFN